jgi:diguanylate cyclase (GGDEF)-like protein/PAS domain S-box-containing protein
MSASDSNETLGTAAMETPLIYLSTEFIQAKEYLEAIVSSTSDAICTTDMQGRLIYVSPGAERMLGRSFGDLMGQVAWRIYKGGRREGERIMKLLLDNGSISDYETVFIGANGRETHVSMSASLIRDKRGMVIGTMGISKDITRRVELEKRLRKLSLTDELTGLHNKRSFKETIGHAVQRAKRQGEKLSILLVDLDNFKEANDRWGHLEGDRILQDTARIIEQSIRRDVDTAYRIGGDEFIVIMPDIGQRMAETVAKRIREAATGKPYARLVSLSIGAASLRCRDTQKDLIARADQRMYKNKRSPRGPRRSDPQTC